MKFDCGPSRKTKIKRKESWHDWFAWYPVRLAEHDCRWLETVERKGTLYYNFSDSWWSYEYREKGHKEEE